MADLVGAGATLSLAYVIGGLSFAFLAARVVKGVDIRTVGSGNARALNVFREVGVAAGVFVLIADLAKGAGAVALPGVVGAPDWTVYVAPIAAVAGHNWPLFMRFRGGRGLAPVLGVSLATVPLLTLAAAIGPIVVIAIFRNVVTAAAVGLFALNGLIIATGQCSELLALCVVLNLIVAGTHLAATWRQYLDAASKLDWMRILLVE